MGWFILILFFSLFIIVLFGYYSILIFAVLFLWGWYDYKRGLKKVKEYTDYLDKLEESERLFAQEKQNKPLISGGLYHTSPSGKKTKLVNIRVDLK